MPNKSSSLHSQSLRLAASAARIGFWSWTPDEGFQWDDSLYALMGLDPAHHEPTPHTLLAYVHPDDRAIIETGSRSIVEGSDVKPKDEFRYRGPDGKLRWFEIHRTLTPGARQVVGLIQDITERKQALDALTASEARLELAASAAKIGIWDWDIDTGRMVYCARAKAISGFAPDQQVTIDDVRAVTHPEDLPFTSAQARRALDPYVRDTSPYEYRILRPDGVVRRVSAHGVALFENRDGVVKAVRYAGTLQDVTESWELSVAKTESQQRLKLAVEAGRMAIWEVDLLANTVSPSPELNRLLGFPDDSRPTIEEIRERYYPGEHARLSMAAKDVLSRGERFMEFEFRYMMADQSVRWLLMRAEFTLTADGTPARAVGVLMDISERKRAEEHIRLLMREVNHRSKNLLAVVQSVASQTASRGHPEDFLQRFGERLQGLAASHDLLVRNAWRGVELQELLRSQLSHFKDLIGTRILLKGPALHLTASAAQTLGMAFHELATNAGKYGSLSGAAGELLISWELLPHENGTRLAILWEERGGPPVEAPKRKGFGTVLITSVTQSALQAEIAFDLGEKGLRWALSAPAEALLQS